MKIKDLFKLEMFVESEDIETLHVELEEPIKIGQVIAPSMGGAWDDFKINGYNLLIFPDNREEAEKVMNFICNETESTKWEEEVIMYIANDYKFRIVVSVNDTNI